MSYVKLCVLGIFFLSIRVHAQVIAKVNDQDISDIDFNNSLSLIGPEKDLILEHQDLKSRYLSHLIDEELKVQHAKRHKLQLSDEFKKRLAQAEKKILAQMAEEHWLNKKVNETSTQLFYEQNKEMFHRSRVKVSHILVSNKEDARMIIKFIERGRKGEGFDFMLRKYSIGKRENGGSIGWIKKGELPLSFDRTLFTCKPGKICSDIVETSSGFYIFKVDDVEYSKKQSYSSLKNEVEDYCLREARESFKLELQRASKVVIADVES